MPSVAGGSSVQVWKLVKDSVAAFIADGALSQGAAIAYYTIFSIAPVSSSLFRLPASYSDMGGSRNRRSLKSLDAGPSPKTLVRTRKQ